MNIVRKLIGEFLQLPQSVARGLSKLIRIFDRLQPEHKCRQRLARLIMKFARQSQLFFLLRRDQPPQQLHSRGFVVLTLGDVSNQASSPHKLIAMKDGPARFSHPTDAASFVHYSKFECLTNTRGTLLKIVECKKLVFRV